MKGNLIKNLLKIITKKITLNIFRQIDIKIIHKNAKIKNEIYLYVFNKNLERFIIVYLIYLQMKNKEMIALCFFLCFCQIYSASIKTITFDQKDLVKVLGPLE